MSIEKQNEDYHLDNTTVIDGDNISTVIEDVKVIGKITYRSGGCIEVTIIEPFQNLSRSHQISFFSRRPVNSYSGAYGDYTAECFLRNMYYEGKKNSLKKQSKSSMKRQIK